MLYHAATVKITFFAEGLLMKVFSMIKSRFTVCPCDL